MDQVSGAGKPPQQFEVKDYLREDGAGISANSSQQASSVYEPSSLAPDSVAISSSSQAGRYSYAGGSSYSATDSSRSFILDFNGSSATTRGISATAGAGESLMGSLLSGGLNEDQYLKKHAASEGGFYSIKTDVLTPYANRLLDKGFRLMAIMAVFQAMQNRARLMIGIWHENQDLQKEISMEVIETMADLMTKTVSALITRVVDHIREKNKTNAERLKKEIEEERYGSDFWSGLGKDLENDMTGGQNDIDKEDRLMIVETVQATIETQIMTEIEQMMRNIFAFGRLSSVYSGVIKGMTGETVTINVKESDFDRLKSQTTQHIEMTNSTGHAPDGDEFHRKDLNESSIVGMKKLQNEMQNVMRMMATQLFGALQNQTNVVSILFGLDLTVKDKPSQMLDTQMDMQSKLFNQYIAALTNFKQHYNQAMKHKIEKNKHQKAQAALIVANSMEMTAIGLSAIPVVGWAVAAATEVAAIGVRYGAKMGVELNQQQFWEPDTELDNIDQIIEMVNLAAGGDQIIVGPGGEVTTFSNKDARDAFRGIADEDKSLIEVDIGGDKVATEKGSSFRYRRNDVHIMQMRQKVADFTMQRRLLYTILLTSLARQAAMVAQLGGYSISEPSGYEGIFESELNLVEFTFDRMVGELQDLIDAQQVKFDHEMKMREHLIMMMTELAITAVFAGISAAQSKAAAQKAAKESASEAAEKVAKESIEKAVKNATKKAVKKSAKLAAKASGNWLKRTAKKAWESTAMASALHTFRTVLAKTIARIFSRLATSEDRINDAYKEKMKQVLKEYKSMRLNAQRLTTTLSEPSQETPLTVKGLLNANHQLNQLTAKEQGLLDKYLMSPEALDQLTQYSGTLSFGETVKSVNAKEVIKFQQQLRDIAMERKMVAMALQTQLESAMSIVATMTGGIPSRKLTTVLNQVVNTQSQLAQSQMQDILSFVQTNVQFENAAANMRAQIKGQALKVGIYGLAVPFLFLAPAVTTVVAAVTAAAVAAGSGSQAAFGQPGQSEKAYLYGETGDVSVDYVDKEAKLVSRELTNATTGSTATRLTIAIRNSFQNFAKNLKKVFDQLNEDILISTRTGLMGGAKSLQGENIAKLKRNLEYHFDVLSAVADVQKAVLNQLRTIASNIGSLKMARDTSAQVADVFNTMRQARIQQFNTVVTNIREKVTRSNEVIRERRQMINEMFTGILQAASGVASRYVASNKIAETLNYKTSLLAKATLVITKALNYFSDNLAFLAIQLDEEDKHTGDDIVAAKAESASLGGAMGMLSSITVQGRDYKIAQEIYEMIRQDALHRQDIVRNFSKLVTQVRNAVLIQPKAMAVVQNWANGELEAITNINQDNPEEVLKAGDKIVVVDTEKEHFKYAKLNTSYRKKVYTVMATEKKAGTNEIVVELVDATGKASTMGIDTEKQSIKLGGKLIHDPASTVYRRTGKLGAVAKSLTYLGAALISPVLGLFHRAKAGYHTAVKDFPKVEGEYSGLKRVFAMLDNIFGSHMQRIIWTQPDGVALPQDMNLNTWSRKAQHVIDQYAKTGQWTTPYVQKDQFIKTLRYQLNQSGIDFKDLGVDAQYLAKQTYIELHSLSLKPLEGDGVIDGAKKFEITKKEGKDRALKDDVWLLDKHDHIQAYSDEKLDKILDKFLNRTHVSEPWSRVREVVRVHVRQQLGKSLGESLLSSAGVFSDKKMQAVVMNDFLRTQSDRVYVDTHSAQTQEAVLSAVLDGVTAEQAVKVSILNARRHELVRKAPRAFTAYFKAMNQRNNGQMAPLDFSPFESMYKGMDSARDGDLTTEYAHDQLRIADAISTYQRLKTALSTYKSGEDLQYMLRLANDIPESYSHDGLNDRSKWVTFINRLGRDVANPELFQKQLLFLQMCVKDRLNHFSKEWMSAVTLRGMHVRQVLKKDVSLTWQETVQNYRRWKETMGADVFKDPFESPISMEDKSIRRIARSFGVLTKKAKKASNMGVVLVDAMMLADDLTANEAVGQ